MVKRIKRKTLQPLSPERRAIFHTLEARMRDSDDFQAIFGSFMDLAEGGPLGKPTNAPDVNALVAAIGRGGLGGMVLTQTPQIRAFRNEDPPLVHGAAMFGPVMVPFVFLPSLGKGLAARTDGAGMMHYQRFTTVALPPGTNVVSGGDAIH